MKDYQLIYNKLLKRYYNGIKFLEENPNLIEKWLPEILDIMAKLNNLIKEYNIKGHNILYGFNEV